MNTKSAAVKSGFTVREVVLDALFIALTFIATMFVGFRLPTIGNGGLIHLGNVPLFVAAILFGRRTGMICGGIGMALFDLCTGWAPWAPFTLVIVGLMGYTVGTISGKSKGNSFWMNLLGMTIALMIKVTGYYFAEVALYGNWLAPLGSIPGNLLQIVSAMIVVLPLIPVLRRAFHIHQ